MMWQATHAARSAAVHRMQPMNWWCTQLTVQTGFKSLVKVLMYVLFMMMRIWALWYSTTYSHYTSHVSWHTLHMTAHMCTQNFSLQGSELNLRPYINCVWFWKLLTHSLTPWSRVLLEKLTSLQVVQKFSVFYVTRRFITAFYVIKF